ncbi:Uncharacterised protein [uncultured archaeon]|nr:Uncharacterised protein [uncultured archaeon]
MQKFILMLALVLLLGCIGIPGVKKLSGGEATEWQRISDPVAEEMLQSLDSGDYGAYAGGFMEIAVPAKDKFDALRLETGKKLGKYKSKKFVAAYENSGEYEGMEIDAIAVQYDAEFEKGTKMVSLTFDKNDSSHKVGELYIDLQE